SLWAAIDLMEHLVPVERRKPGALQLLLDLVEQRSLRAHEARPRLEHGSCRIGSHHSHPTRYCLQLHGCYCMRLHEFAVHRNTGFSPAVTETLNETVFLARRLLALPAYCPPRGRPAIRQSQGRHEDQGDGWRRRLQDGEPTWLRA